MTAPELLPCPFCGDNRASTYHVRDGRVSMCPACGAKSGSQFNGPLDLPSADDRAIAAWNRRTPSPEVAALIAEARREAEEMTDGLVKASAWVSVAAEVLAGYNRDLGVDLPDTTEIGRIDESRDTPSFRITVGHIRILAAAIRALKEETP